MDASRWEELETLFGHARALPPEQRAAFVEQRCADDAALHAQVTSLLAAYEKAPGYFESLAGGLPLPARLEAYDPQGQGAEEDSYRLVGRTVSHYRILERLGGGNMGVVYRAEDTRLRRPVALKFLPPELRAPEARQRFVREAQAASSLDHPNICTIHEIDETPALAGAGGQTFIAMTYYRGETLKKRIERGPLPVEEAVDIALQVGQGLERAHEAGILHRDIKPANIMITDRGEVKIVDFGLAKFASGTTLTDAGTVVGTPAYMSPEQIQGEKADAQADLWALGVVLYEMLTGERPFRGEYRLAVMYAILEEDPEPVRSLREVPEELERIVTKSLQKDPARRYQKADELLADLRAARAAMAPAKAAAPSGEVQRVRPRRAYLYGTMLVLFVLAVAGMFFAGLRGGAAEEQASGRYRLAVLPLDSYSPDPEDAYFADGMTEELISKLSQLSGLRVIARASVMPYKGVRKSLAVVGQELGVRMILHGSVRIAADQLRITVQLSDVQTQEQLWSHDYDRALAMEQVLSTQSDIARRVAGALQVKLMAEEERQIEKQATENLEAYTLYLKGRYFWDKRTKEGFERAIACFREAIGLDSSYALAWVGLAYAYNTLGVYSFLPPQEAHPKAREAAERALALDDELAEGHTSMAAVLQDYYWNWSKAEHHYERAFALNANYATAHQWYAVLLARLGRLEEALREAQRARELNPLSLMINTHMGQVLYFMGRHDEAIEQLRRTLEMDSTFVTAHLILGQTYLQAGRGEEAVSAFQRGVALGGRMDALMLLGYAYAAMGRRGEAQQILDELTRQSERQYVPPMAMATLYTGLGDRERAFAWLEKGYDDRNWHLTLLKVEPFFGPLRGDPRFGMLLEKMGLKT